MSCCLLTLCGEAQKGLKKMSDGCYKNIPQIPQKSHFHGNMYIYREAQSLTAANSSNNYYPPCIYYICFHLPVSYFIVFFSLKMEATLIYAAGAASQTLLHNDRRPPLRSAHRSSLCPWKLTLGSCFAGQITGNHPQTHALLGEIRV